MTGRRRAVAGTAALCTALVVLDAALVIRAMTLAGPSLGTEPATPVLVTAVLAVVALAALLLELPRVQVVTLVLAVACGPAANLALDPFDGTWAVVGVLAEAAQLPLLLSFVLRYPAARLTRPARIWLAVATVLLAAPVVGYDLIIDLPLGVTVREPLVVVDDPTVRAVIGLAADAAQTVAWCGTSLLLLRRAVRARGAARAGAAVLAGAVAVVTVLAVVSAAADGAIALGRLATGDHVVILQLETRFQDVRDLLDHGGPAGPLLLALAPLADVARRRSAAGTVTDQVLSAAGDGLGPRLDAAVAGALGDPAARVVAPELPTATGRRAILVPGASGALGRIEVQPDAGYTNDARHVAAVVDAVGLGLETVAGRRGREEYRDELERSRRALVDAAATERRSVERDLHDGVQQALLGLGAVLARAALQTGRGPLVEALHEARARLGAVLRDLDRLAAGLSPDALERDGLEPALGALAAGCPLPVGLELTGLGELPPAAASAAWFVVAEALTNAVKHARASMVVVRARSDGAVLRVTVDDDGVGGARPAPGGGLEGLRRRVDLAGGRLDVHDGEGTRVEAVLPLVAAVPDPRTPRVGAGAEPSW